MNDQSGNFAEQGAAFQKLWLESMSKLMQSAGTFPPNSAPPEILREIRGGILRALAEAWNDFMRTPEFQEGMKQWMESALAFRKLSGDFMTKVRKEMQAPSREDVDAILLSMRHIETRVLDRLEELSKRIEELNELSRPAGNPPTGANAPVRKPSGRKAARRKAAGNTKRARKP